METDSDADCELLFGLPNELSLLILDWCTLYSKYVMTFVSKTSRRLATDSALGLKTLMMDRAYVEAILDCILAAFPTSYEAYKERAGCWMDLEKPKRALKELNMAVEVCDSPAYLQMLKSQQCWATKRLQQAWEYVNKAVELDPKDPRFYHFRAYIQSTLASGGDKVSLQKEYDDYMKIINELKYKRTAIVYNNLGYLCYERKEHMKALALFQKSLDMCPHHVQAHYNRAVVFGDLNRVQDAMTEVTKLLEINPDLEDGIIMRSLCHIHSDNFDKAAEDYRLVTLRRNARNRVSGHMLSVFSGVQVTVGHGLRALTDFQTAIIPAQKLKYHKYVDHKAEREAESNPHRIFNRDRYWEVIGTLQSAHRLSTEIAGCLGRFDEAKKHFSALTEMLDRHRVEREEAKRSDEMGIPWSKLCEFSQFLLDNHLIQHFEISRECIELVHELFIQHKQRRMKQCLNKLIEHATYIFRNSSELFYFSAALAYRFDSIYWIRGQGIVLEEFVDFIENSSRAKALAYIPFLAALFVERSRQGMLLEGDVEELTDIFEEHRSQSGRSQNMEDLIQNSHFRQDLCDYAKQLHWTINPFN